ncbi:hypothetical protein HMSSN036_64040 [Paenibacillus macerans]|nr:hypothetical protein HMSSN036_64040 [Paenibacillus macerans]
MEAAASDAARLQELMKQQEEAEAELERLMERWTYLNELAEKSQPSAIHKADGFTSGCGMHTA